MIWLLVVVTVDVILLIYNMNDDDMVAYCRNWLM